MFKSSVEAPLDQEYIKGGVPPVTTKLIAPVFALKQSNGFETVAFNSNSKGSIMMKLSFIIHDFASVIVTLYFPGPKLFLSTPAVVSSSQTKVTGVLPPTRFNRICASFSPKQEICFTSGLIVKTGALSMIMVNWSAVR